MTTASEARSAMNARYRPFQSTRGDWFAWDRDALFVSRDGSSHAESGDFLRLHGVAVSFPSEQAAQSACDALESVTR